MKWKHALLNFLLSNWCTKFHWSIERPREGFAWCGLRVFIWGEKPKLQKNAFLIGKMGKCLGWRPLAASCLNPPVGALEKGDVSNKYSLYTIPMVPPIFCMTFGKTLFLQPICVINQCIKANNHCFVIQVVFLHKKSGPNLLTSQISTCWIQGNFGGEGIPSLNPPFVVTWVRYNLPPFFFRHVFLTSPWGDGVGRKFQQTFITKKSSKTRF